MKITHGLLAGQVLQRDKRKRGGAIIEGSCRSEGDVELRVTKSGKTVKGQNWLPVGKAQKKTFSARLENLHTGGPYRVELRIRSGRTAVESVTVNEVFVGDVWILAGQSNMQGVGNLADAPKPHPLVRAFYMRDEWDQAEERLHLLEEAVDTVHSGYGDGPDRPPRSAFDKMRRTVVKGVGPGLAFGLDMRKRTRVPQGLIVCAHGGTSMEQWSPERRNQGGASLYGAMMRRYEKLGQPVAGVLWYQGESDANPKDAKVYTQKMVELVEASRRDMELPKLPWLIVQLGCHACPEGGPAWNSIQEQQRRLPEVIPQLDVASAIDLGLDDGIHISGKEQIVLGQRLARIADRLVHKNRKTKPGIRLKEIRLVRKPSGPNPKPSPDIEVVYSNVAGKLTSQGRPTGFVLLDEHGNDTCSIYKTTLSGKSAFLYTNHSQFQLENFTLSYGHGRFPYCNITDSEGMSIPGMQTVPFAQDLPRQCKKWKSAHLTGVLNLAALTVAKASREKTWRKAPKRGGGGFLPSPPKQGKTGVFSMRTVVTAKEDLSARIEFGSNIPFILWLNGKQVLSDPKASPPFVPEKYEATLQFNKGKNELLLGVQLDKPTGFSGIAARLGTKDRQVEPRLSY